MFITVWVLSMIATLIIADQKRLGVLGYFFLSIFLGPVAVIIVLMMSDKKVQQGNILFGSNTLEDAKRQLRDLQFSFYAQEEKIKHLEDLINKLSGSPQAEPFQNVVRSETIVAKTDPLPVLEPYGEPKPEKRSDMELDFGRNWLNKIGIVVLALGMAFLISYTFKYFGPFIKITFGFIVGGALFYTGIKLETKEKLMHFGRALLGGAWAIIYFTTYAMYHFETSRVISSQGLDLILLALVVLGMMVHALKYRSEEMMAVALFVAYLTSTIGQITSFTVFSNLFLAVLILFLVYKFQWVRILSFGIAMTYGVHCIWVVPNLMASFPMSPLFGVRTINSYDLMNFIFLSTYGLAFFIGVHSLKSTKESSSDRTLSAANFGNIALYSALSYPLVLKLFYDQRFIIFLVEGLVYLAAALVMKKTKQEKMYISDIVAAVFAITFSISLKFLPTTTLIAWLVEIPFLLYIGVNYKEKVYNYLSYALSALVVIRFISLSIFGGMPDVYFMGFDCTWAGFMSFCASASMAGCFYLTQRFKYDVEVNDFDRFFDQVFSFAACLYFSIWIWSFIHQPWTALSLSVQGWAFLMISVWLGLRRFRAYAYLALTVSASLFLCDHIYASSEFLKWFIVSGDVLSIFGVYHAVKYFKNHKPGDLFFEYEEEISFAAGLCLLIFVIFQYVDPPWISLSLGVASVVLILMGFISGNKTERMGGMALLALTLGRVVLVDLSGLDIIFKIITLIVLGVLFLGVSYIYNKFSIKKS